MQVLLSFGPEIFFDVISADQQYLLESHRTVAVGKTSEFFDNRLPLQTEDFDFIFVRPR